ncbi:MAG: YdeI/OmpD-associated family protein [Candidatus Paceibacterota bacterium]|jgi:uncharacterized protein YdeI (YjbR/CyaY-like superfamily)
MNPKKEPEIKVPADLRKALSAAPKIETLWKGITPIARRDFVRWIESAKKSETRKRRVEVTLSKLASGQRRPCCYAVVPMNLYKALGESLKAKAVWKDLTPTERRDFVSWIDEASNTEDSKLRVVKVIGTLASGKRKI